MKKRYIKYANVTIEEYVLRDGMYIANRLYMCVSGIWSNNISEGIYFDDEIKDINATEITEEEAFLECL